VICDMNLFFFLVRRGDHLVYSVFDLRLSAIYRLVISVHILLLIFMPLMWIASSLFSVYFVQIWWSDIEGLQYTYDGLMIRQQPR